MFHLSGIEPAFERRLKWFASAAFTCMGITTNDNFVFNNVTKIL